MVKVDASNVGVKAIFSRMPVNDNKLHPSTFLSCELSGAERNYNIGDGTTSRQGGLGGMVTLPEKGLKCHFWSGQIRRSFTTLRWLKDSVKDGIVF